MVNSILGLLISKLVVSAFPKYPLSGYIRILMDIQACVRIELLGWWRQEYFKDLSPIHFYLFFTARIFQSLSLVMRDCEDDCNCLCQGRDRRFNVSGKASTELSSGSVTVHKRLEEKNYPPVCSTNTGSPGNIPLSTSKYEYIVNHFNTKLEIASVPRTKLWAVIPVLRAS